MTTLAPPYAAPGPLDGYAAAPGDLYGDAPGEVAAKWQAMAEGLAALAADAGVSAEELVGRQILDLGMSFRIAGDSDERPWPLAPMPLIIDAAEWDGLARGLVQRAELLEAVVADIYGPQRLVAEGHLPAAVVTGSPYFARGMAGRAASGHYLQVYAVDLARGPRGQWRVLADRLRLANGIGYVLENRLALSRVAGSLLTDLNTRRFAHFFGELRAGIAARCGRENPRIALLTPGRFNQSYPEQAHLARYLGFPLVEGRDLAVSDDRLWLRTIGGPKRVDAVWRWIDSNALDPLAFDAQSQIGVPDLYDAWTRGGVEIANRPGVEVVEAPAFAAFLPRLCEVLLGEAPILPNLATWWCGQPAEAAQVAARIDQLLIAPAFGQPVEGLPGRGATALARLDGAARATLLAAMARRPMDYCGQEIVNLSSTPTLTGSGGEEGMAPRAFTLRAFVARGGDGQWLVMPGGFARLSASGEISTTLMGEGELSADVCVVDPQPVARFASSVLAGAPAVRRGGSILASQAADNLYWFGRYCERGEMTARILRAMLGTPLDEAGGAEAHGLLVNQLWNWGALPPESFGLAPAEACRSVLTDPVSPGALPHLLAMVRETGAALRDRFAPDFWRIASRPLPTPPSSRTGATLRAARELVERFGALSGLVSENLVRGPVWRFLDLGRRIERAMLVCRLARQLSRGTDQSAAMGVLLDLCDSQITYRSRYLAAPARDAVLDLLLLDGENPRSLAFQIEAIAAHLAELPRLDETGVPEAPLRQAQALLAPLRSLTVAEWDDRLLGSHEAGLIALSEAITARYFLAVEKPEPGPPGMLA